MTAISVDTNVLLAVLYDDLRAGNAEAVLRDAYQQGRLIIAPIVYSDLAVEDYFETKDELDTFLDDMSISISELSHTGLFQAGTAFKTYTQRFPDGFECPVCGTEQSVSCPECGKDFSPRQHTVASFLIGGHAVADADELLTFDSGFYESYFPGLSVSP